MAAMAAWPPLTLAACRGLDLGGAGGVGFVDVEDDEEGLVGEELVVDQHLALFVGHRLVTQRRVRFEPRLQTLEERRLALGGVALADLHGPHRCLDAFEALLDEGGVGEGELELHGGRVAGRVHGALGVGDGLVGEGADDVDEGVAAGELCEELRGRALAVAEGLAGEVDVADVGEGELLRVEELRELVEAFVGDLDDADVGLDAGAVRARLRVALRDGVEDGGLAGALEADDAEIHGFEVTGDRGQGIGWRSFAHRAAGCASLRAATPSLENKTSGGTPPGAPRQRALRSLHSLLCVPG